MGGFSPESMSVAQNYQEDGGHPFSAQEIVAKLMVKDGTTQDKAAAKSYQADMSGTRLREYLDTKSAANFFSLFDGSGFGMISLPFNFGDGHVIPDLTTKRSSRAPTITTLSLSFLAPIATNPPCS